MPTGGVDDLGGHAVLVLLADARVRVPAARVHLLEADAGGADLLGRLPGGRDQPHGHGVVEPVAEEGVAELLDVPHLRGQVLPLGVDEVDVGVGGLADVAVGGDDRIGDVHGASSGARQCTAAGRASGGRMRHPAEPTRRCHEVRSHVRQRRPVRDARGSHPPGPAPRKRPASSRSGPWSTSSCRRATRAPTPTAATARCRAPRNPPIPDPFVWLSYAAAVTERIHLGTGVLILPQRHPFYVAKEVATLDVLSKGRVELGVGIGWLEEEFNGLGVPFKERAGRTEESIEALRTLWSDGPSEVHGRYYDWKPGGVEPEARGAEGAHPRGGSRRGAPRGERPGWATASSRRALDTLDTCLAALREECDRIGRDPGEIEISTGAKLHRRRDQGARGQGRLARGHRTAGLHARGRDEGTRGPGPTRSWSKF